MTTIEPTPTPTNTAAREPDMEAVMAFVGSDYHGASIATARKRAEKAQVADRVRLEHADAQSLSSLSQDVGLALGTRAGLARVREVVTRAEFSGFRTAAETPFNMVLEATP